MAAAELVGCCQKARIAFQLVAELMQRGQSFFCFPKELFVRFEGVEQHRVVDVQDCGASFGKLLSPKNVFVAIFAESFVQRVAQEETAFDKEIGGVEVGIGLLCALTGRRGMACCRLLIAEPEISAECHRVASQAISSIDGPPLASQIAT